MSYDGIVLTGTRASGKTTVARKLSEHYSQYEAVKAVTTRDPRPDDGDGQYDHLALREFRDLSDSGSLVTDVTYSDHCYGIRVADIKRIIAANRSPIAVIAPESMSQFQIWANDEGSWEDLNYLYVFLDAPNDSLDRRLATRVDTIEPSQAELDRREEDRQYQDYCLYTCINDELDRTVRLLRSLDKMKHRSGVLTSRLVELMLDSDMLLRHASHDCVEGASYDLRLGDDYYRAGTMKSLSEQDPLLEIQPYDYAIVTSREEANLPRDICGRFGLSVSLFCQGIILSNGPQVDPGFQGPLFCLLFNTSNSPVVLTRGEHYATLELRKTIEPTAKYEGEYMGRKLGYYLPHNAARGAVRELKEDLERVEREYRRLQNRLYAVLSIILALVAVFVAFSR